MESTGIKDKIQISQATADLLTEAGKAHWFKGREDLVEAKGKGKMRTFWLDASAKIRGSSTPSESNSQVDLEGFYQPDEDIVKRNQNVDWMVELLLEYARKIVSFLTQQIEKKETSFLDVPVSFRCVIFTLDGEEKKWKI